MRKVAYLVLGLVLAIFVTFVLWRVSKSRTFQFFGEIIPRVETAEKVIALTFDDGPTPIFTDKILNILRANDVKATFFLIGGEIEKYPDETKKIVADGHEIGNHSYSHERMVLVTPSFVKEEIERTDNLIRNSGYHAPIHFRPPYGKKLFVLPHYLSTTGRKAITWDVEPESDPEISANTDLIIEHVAESVKPGSVILLHVMYDREQRSLNAVNRIIESSKNKGFRFVTVSELLTYTQDHLRLTN